MSKKVCDAVKKKLPKENPKKYRDMVRDATYFCKVCGHVSKKKSCLCKPEEI